MGKKRVCRNLVDGWVLGTHKYIFVRVQVSLLVLNKILGCVFARFLEPSKKSISDINKNETLEFLKNLLIILYLISTPLPLKKEKEKEK